MSYHRPQPLRGLHGPDEDQQRKASLVGLGIATAIAIAIVAFSVRKNAKEEQQDFKAHLARAKKTYGGKTGTIPREIERDIYKLYNRPLPARLQATGLGF